MGKKDTVTKKYMSVPKHFADTLRELNQSEEYIIDKIMNKFQLSENETKEIMK